MKVIAFLKIKINKQIGRLLYVFRRQGGERYIQNLLKNKNIKVINPSGKSVKQLH